jgi:glycosyltransferase involved in cell wall biosynthesis
MKVLFIQKEGGIFGAEQFQLRTIPALISKGINVEFLRLYTDYQLGINSPFVTKLEAMGCPVHQVKITKIPLPAQFFKIKKVIKNGNYDIVHTHLIHADFYGAVVKKFLLPKLKLVSTKHGYEEGYNNRYGFNPDYKRKDLYWKMNKFSESVVDKSFAISDGLRNFFIDTQISKSHKLDRIHYGFEMKSHQVNLNSEKFRFSENQLVLAGRLVGFKGHRYALEALKILKIDFPDILLLIIGIGELEQELKDLASNLGVSENIKFLGYSSEVENFMYHSDIVLIPSIAEGFGVVFLEAINQRKPIAAFDVPAGNEILPKSYKKYLSAPFDTQQYAGVIKTILKNPKEMEQPILDAEERLLSYFKLERMIYEIHLFYKNILLNK